MDTSKPHEERETPLRAVRKRRGLTLQDVAKAVGTDTGNLSRLEKGNQVSLEMAAKLAGFYGSDEITEMQILYPERYMKALPVEHGEAG